MVTLVAVVLRALQFAMAMFVIFFILMFSYLFWLDSSFQVAKRHETKEKIEARLYFVSIRRIRLSDVDFLWADDDFMIGRMLPKPDTELYEYCLLNNCFHVSHDPEGRKLFAFDTYE